MSSDNEFEETVAGSFGHLEQHIGQEAYQAGVFKEQAIAMWFGERAKFWELLRGMTFFLFIPLYVVIVLGVIWVFRLVFK